MRTLWIAPLLAGCLWLTGRPGWAAAVPVPLELRLNQPCFNLGSQRGMPISPTVNNPPGSDGRMPTSNDSGGAGLPRPNQYQFSSVISFGGVTAATNQGALKANTAINGTNAFSATVAAGMQMPVARSNDVIVMVLRRAQVAAPYLSRQVSFAFGSIVSVPYTDERGVLLTNIVKEAYWKLEPYSTNNHQTSDYYWSPHANAVFASQSGPLSLTWRKAASYTTANLPAYTNLNGTVSFETNGANVFLLYTMRYVISGSPVKTPRKMYWTEGSYRGLGKTISVPGTSVPGGVKVVYNRSVPESVDNVYMAGELSDDPYFGTTNAHRTFYFNASDHYLHAYNVEGRIFVELLGNTVSGEIRQHLGFEIVDVFKQPTPSDVAVDLGDQIVPPAPGSLSELSPEPIVQTSGGSFDYQHNIAGSDRFEYFAVRETENQNDYQVHWMETGIAGLKWPSLFGRYKLGWPQDVTRYSQYLRPRVATEAEARETAVTLSTENVPIISYQDPCDRPRANLTEEFKFYTFLTTDYPIHRTLLRFTSGEYVGFERVLSLLDGEVLWPTSTVGGWARATTLSFDGFGGYAQMPPGVYFTPTTSFCVESWVRLGKYNPGERLFDFGNGAPDNNVLLTLSQGATGLPSFEIYQGSSASKVTSTTQLPLGEWFHIAAVYDAAKSIGILYLNGAEIARGPLLSPNNVVRTNNYIARSNWAADGYASAEVDDFRVWSTARTQAQIADGMRQNYPSGTAGLTAQYLFNADSGNGAALTPDSSGNNRSLTLAGANLQLTQRPRSIEAAAVVGRRITAPALESGSEAGSPYLAGYILQSAGTSFDVNAYVDPFVNGFDAANLGAIIPVNAIPGRNAMEVWWFRTNAPAAGLNAGNTRKGFKPIFWPAVLARYSIAWPSDAPEIVLASKLGGGTLENRLAAGSIYVQNDPNAPGYNPNEEHALMSGGTVYATRDDLNLTTPANYSSQPFVLLDYKAADGRPAMAVFKVLREKPEAGWVFDYVVPAGQLLQPPPPLTFLGKPVEGTGDAAVDFTYEPSATSGDLPQAWNQTRDGNGQYRHYVRFTHEDRHNDFWVYRGPHGGLPPLQAGTFIATNGSFASTISATAVTNVPFQLTLHASRQQEYLKLTAPTLPTWLSISGLTLTGTPATATGGTTTIDLVLTDRYDQTSVTNRLVLRVVTSGNAVSQGPLTISSTNAFTGSVVLFSNRPPFLALSPNPTNSFTMRYFYRTQPGFAWPGFANPPETGSIVPYLRRYDPTNNVFAGGDGASTSTTPLDIVYRPFWPVRDPMNETKPLPSIPYGMTVTKPASDLPGVRDMKTARLLYQQSIAANIAQPRASVSLHDPTRAKYSSLQSQNLAKIPTGVRTEYYQGFYFFPDLPPHLGQRLYFDPSRGTGGSLVLEGKFVQETLGESYLLLNVLRGTDLAAAEALCAKVDPDLSKWKALVNALSTQLETFYQDPTNRARYVPNPDLTTPIGVADLALIGDDNTAVDSYALSATGPGEGYVTLVEGDGAAFTEPGDPVSMHIFRTRRELHAGTVKVLTAANPLSELVSFQHTSDLAGAFDQFDYEWKIAAPVNGSQPTVTDPDSMAPYLILTNGVSVPRVTIGGAGIQALSDNYVIMRYRPRDQAHPMYQQWSSWTAPALAEGWIKRVLAGINPFNQRVGDLFNNQANTDVSMLTQAGRRWEGDVALNASSLNNYGLIEIYETVLRRGRMLSIESGFNYGPANDALLLAAGYLNDLYLFLGNEAWADAANPTIGIGTKDSTYGDIATALFAFKGQVPSLLEEELALLRGRDDFQQPGVMVAPVYNRLVWNYTRGIDSGEVIYALNYNIQENPNAAPDGVINASDAARMYPQGHGDAYGHYLTAVKGYYSLLLNSNFDWVPRSEAVNVLGTPVQVDYQDERKFAAAAAALGRAGRQVFDLTWRRDFQPVSKVGWSHLGDSRTNPNRNTTRFWGADHWNSRVGQGLYLNWVVGNAILPDVDDNPDHEGIQKIDRTTVPELPELVSLASDQQTAMDNAEGSLSPLGLPADSLAFDINPSSVVGTDNGTHFEQIYGRALVALENAVAAFDDAKDVTGRMRSEQDSLADFQAKVADQEHAYQNGLIELYGTPYPDDMGAGRTYTQNYDGPDLIHYSYVDLPESDFGGSLSPQKPQTNRVDIQTMPADAANRLFGSIADLETAMNFVVSGSSPKYSNGVDYIEFVFGPHGYFDRPTNWTSQRRSPGQIQQAISDLIKAHDRVAAALSDAESAKSSMDRALSMFIANVNTYDATRDYKRSEAAADQAVAAVAYASRVWDLISDHEKANLEDMEKTALEAIPKELIAGLAAGGDLTSGARAAVLAAGGTVKMVTDWTKIIKFIASDSFSFSTETAKRWIDFDKIAPLEWQQQLRGNVAALQDSFGALSGGFSTINERLRAYDDARRKLRALIASGDRIQEERLTYRKHAAAVVQGYRTRDAAFRLFRNEKLERYKTLFDLAARYAMLAANAYDYETGLLDTDQGRAFVNRIVNARSLGVVRNGQPQYAGSDTGDPGLSSVLAEMKADWDVLRGRLGFNNPDAYGTTASLRTELLRILPGTDGDTQWKDTLIRAQKENLLDDPDVRRYCMQIDLGDGLPVPGIVLTFSTTITPHCNLFGQPLAQGDHAFSLSAFATKIFAAGVALEGYRGMDNPPGVTPTSDTAGPWYLDPLALAANPYVYLIPVGVDSMRTPPLGDASTIRSWTVEDVAIPLPFNIGASDFSTKAIWQSDDALTEPLFGLRKHQSFRPVASASYFNDDLYGANNTLHRSQYTNNRLVGRSVWNSQWKLVIPADTLLEDPYEGLDRFLRTVKDIKIHFVTYSYSGN